MPHSLTNYGVMIGLALVVPFSLRWASVFYAPLSAGIAVHDDATSHGTDRPPSTSHNVHSSPGRSTADAGGTPNPDRPTCGTSRLLEELEQAKRGCKADVDCVLLWEFKERDERITASASTLNRTTARLRDLLTFRGDARSGMCGPSAADGAPRAKCQSGMCEVAFDE